MGIVTYR